jgi:hypothetical protein
MVITKPILEKFEKIIENVAPEKAERLANELSKVVPVPYSPVEWKIACNRDEKLGLLHCSISFKTQISTSVTTYKDLQSLFPLFLENIEEPAFTKLENAFNLILEYANPPYQLSVLPSLQTETGIGIIYFTIEGKIKI